ncbi:MAG: 3-isopropylmalate dehydratase large subunit [Rhodobacteraceae bacterium]|nr:3-isopropylmalate dehydratase large subunit [Paracoccaceae bacterium]
MTPRTIIEKIWSRHRILSDGDRDLLFVDRHYVHEGSHHAFDKIAQMGRALRRPDATFGVADHYVPVHQKSPGKGANADILRMIEQLAQNASSHGFLAFGPKDKRQGIVHVTMPELGLTLPGMIVVCGDSHTATHGALGAFAFGIGASEVAHVLATQTLWQAPPAMMKLVVEGKLGRHITAKDLALHIICMIGTGGATGHTIEYAGSAISALDIEERMTLCNMTIEMGARSGIIAPDDKTLRWLEGRPYAPDRPDWDAALAGWRALASDPGAHFHREVVIDGSEVAPMVTWGTSPQDVMPVTDCVPATAEACEARAYMGLMDGQRIEGLSIDQAFIGSCTNGRLSDLAAAAAVLAGREVRVPLLISPGSQKVRAQAEETGIADILRSAGAIFADSGCSLCVGMNGDRVPSGARCASSTNRNFRGRQGPGSRTHLMSPAMVAAAAVKGVIVDVRNLDTATVEVVK